MTGTNQPSAEEALDASKQQFGANAANYAHSNVHAKGASLHRLVEMIEPQSDWRALDIAAAAGHMAYAVAPHVTSVVVSDATPEMLEVAEALASERGITNVTFEEADAHRLPFDDASFDLVTCRIAPHHFSDPQAFVAESARVLRPNGIFAVCDNINPEAPDAARWIDDFERRRDRSHLRCLPLSEWFDLIDAAGLTVEQSETMGKHMDFVTWADNMAVPDDVRRELRDDLGKAPAEAHAWLQPTLPPDGELDGAAFVLTEGLIIARKP